MEGNAKPIGIDGTGYDVLTVAVRDLLNTYPGLGDYPVKFEELDENSGIAFSSDNGALILSERKTVTGKTVQTCNYPFYIVFRASGDLERQKLFVQKFLDGIGKWICKEPVEIDGYVQKLDAFPVLSENRKITNITRMNSYGLTPNANGVQDWLLPCTVEYKHEFYK